MHLTPQPFDSSIFGGPVFRLTAPEPAAEPLEALLDDALRQDARLVMARIPATDRETMLALEANGFTPVETLVTLEAAVDGPADFPPRIRKGGPDSAAACAEIARTAFLFDRFHADRRIDPEMAARMKEAWVRNGFAGRAEACLVAMAEGETAGFLLTLRQPEALVIDLIAVAPGHQGLGLGRDLVAAAKAHAALVGAAIVRVGTQAANQASLRLYSGAGFAPVGQSVTFHFIPEKRQYCPAVRP